MLALVGIFKFSVKNITLNTEYAFCFYFDGGTITESSAIFL